jgi:hypothetical protein
VSELRMVSDRDEEASGKKNLGNVSEEKKTIVARTSLAGENRSVQKSLDAAD